MKIPALAAAASMMMAPAAMAQVLTNTVTEYQLGGQTIDAKTQLPTGTAKISTGSPWNAILKIIPGSACAPNICPLSFLEVGFEMAGFTGLAAPQVPSCSATLMDGAFYPLIFGSGESEADSWPTGTMLTVDYDPAGLPLNGQGKYTYYVRVKGPPLGNPEALPSEPAAVFQTGTHLRVYVECGAS